MFAFGLAIVGCSDPFGLDTASQQEEICAASAEWLPNTPPADLFKPLPHPAGDCPFYRGGWQNFLVATQPDASGQPALRTLPTIDTVFQSAKPKAAMRAWLGDIKQAGGRQILIDQNGNPIFYGIHVNQAYADFINEHNLRTKDAVQNADPTLFFPAGVVEFKSAWQVVENNEPSDDYITIPATVPTLSVDPTTHLIVEDRNIPRSVTVRMLALHVVYTLPGHPEFVWATFEHIDGDGNSNVAPVAAANPDRADPFNLHDHAVVSPSPFLLFKGGTTADAGNQPIGDLGLMLDPTTQKFAGQQTSIYRMYPAAKSNTVDADNAITSLNANVRALFAKAASDGMLSPMDKRGHYRIVGAVWMDKPEFFRLNASIENDQTSPLADKPDFVKAIGADGSDSELSVLGGEDRLSSTSLESFTQGPASFPNCFSCHNTQAVTAKGVPLDHDQNGVKLLDPKLINISHVLSQFVLEESQ